MKYEQKAPKDRPIIISYLSPSLSLSQNHDNSYILSHIYFYEFSITSDGGCWKKESMKWYSKKKKEKKKKEKVSMKCSSSLDIMSTGHYLPKTKCQQYIDPRSHHRINFREHYDFYCAWFHSLFILDYYWYISLNNIRIYELIFNYYYFCPREHLKIKNN